jgi:SAM-dependent methyltransferase
VTLAETLSRRFARLVTEAVVRRPGLWRVLRRPLAFQFDRLASRWNRIIQPGHLAPLEAALDAVEEAPRRVLDLGTGTGAAAVAVARRWPEAEVVGVDLAEQMVEEARRQLPADLAARVRFQTGDAARLPFPDGTFDLVVLANMIPFFDELARVTAAGGRAVFAFSGGAGTPIYVAPERLRAELGRRGFSHFATFSAGRGTALLATKRAPP